MNQNQSALLDTKEAANYIGSTPSVLRISRVKGELYQGIRAPDFIKLGRSVRYRIDDLDAWIEKYASKRAHKITGS